jgi:hypothetical protein
MDEPEPLPAFTFSPDEPATITYPDGTVSVNSPLPGDPAVIPDSEPDEPVTATPAADAPSSVFPPETPEDSQPVVTVADPAPSGNSVMSGISASVAEAAAPADVPGASEPQTSGAAPAGVAGDAEPQASGSPPADEPGVAESPTWAAPTADAQVGSEPQAPGMAPVAAPATTLHAWGAPTTTAEADASGSVVNPDGSITTRLPDGSTQTVARLPGGATIVISTTRPGEDPQPPPAEPQRSRRWRGRSK